MTGPMHSHEPTPEFRAHLEWQIETAMRRESRLAEPVTSAPLGGLRRFGTAALVIVALAIGGAAGIASERVQDVKTRDQLLESARAEESLLRTRMELARSEFQEARKRFEVGATGRESLIAAEQQLRAMEAALARLQLDMEEMRATRSAPRNELNAPLVGQRDFVRDRLMIDLERKQQSLAAAEQALAQARERVNVGLAMQAAQLEAESQLAAARAAMLSLQAQLDARQKVLRREITGEEAARMVRQKEMTLQLERGQKEIQMLKQRLDEARKQLQVGALSQVEVKRAELQLLEREVELKMLQQQLDAISKK